MTDLIPETCQMDGCETPLVDPDWIETLVDDEVKFICPPCFDKLETYMANTGQD